MIKKFLSTEKSFNNQDKGIWTFLVNKDANKGAIKKAAEKLFGVKISNVTTTYHREKIRRAGGKRFVTRRHCLKVARLTLKDKSKKIDLTKLQK